MKHCKKCGALKAVHDFYARDGACKECRKAGVRQNYAQNREHYREYEQSRALLPHRVEARERYMATENGREKSNSGKRAYIARNGEKRHAHIAVENAVRDKKLFKSPCCTAPGCYGTENIQGHHTHYSEPLSVVWLCGSCHAQLHREHNRQHKEAA